MFFLSLTMIKTIMLKDVQQQQKQKSAFNSASYSSKNMNEHEKNHLFEDEEIRIIGTSPAISRVFSPIDRNIEIPQTHHFSERKPDNNWKSCGKHDSSYYQPQPATYNQRPQYHNDRRTQQYTSRNDFCKEKVGKHGNIHSGITTPEKNPHITLGNDSYARKKTPTDSSVTYLRTETISMQKNH